MNRFRVFFPFLALFSASVVHSQIGLNTVPSRTAGHPKTTLPEQNSLYSASPNLVEGRELYHPLGMALDNSVTPPALYVSDTGNNRVLGWKNASDFKNGQIADIVIGQNDFFTTWPAGPTTTPRAPNASAPQQSGLTSPTGLAVRNGDLYVVDSGNNRVLRYPRPFENADHIPNLVIGQPSLNVTSANFTGDVSAQGVYFSSSTVAFAESIAFDDSGNLWLTDPGNRRVLEFAAADVARPGGAGLTAICVLGQLDFGTTRTNLSVTVANLKVADQFAIPSALAFDSKGRLFVADYDASASTFSRVLAFVPPFSTAMSASRIMGVVAATQNLTKPQQYATIFNSPSALFILQPNDTVGVVDTGYSRVLLFPAFDAWPKDDVQFSPQAAVVVGHPDFTSFLANDTPVTQTYSSPPSATVFSQPAAAAVGNGELFIADAGNNRVLALPIANTAVSPATRVLGQERMDTGSVNLVESRGLQFMPASSFRDAGLAIDSTGSTPHLYVADTYNNRVLGYKDMRKVVAGAPADLVIGQADFASSLCNSTGNPAAPTDSSLCGPVGLLVDSAANLWVADRGNGRVLRFPAPFAQTGQPKADLVLGQASFTGSRVTNATQSTMASPSGLAMTVSGYLAVSDQSHDRILVFAPANGAFQNGQSAVKVIGQYDFRSTASGTDMASLNAPRHLAADKDGRLYVADAGNNRVLIYDSVEGLFFPTSGGSAAKAITGLSTPLGVYVNPGTGEIWIAEANTGKFLRYPSYAALLTSPTSLGSIASPGYALTMAQDLYGALVTADSTNRIAFYFPGLKTQNLANMVDGRPLAPGMIASVLPVNTTNPFGADTVDFGGHLALPKILGGIQVLVDGKEASLYMVSPLQINFQVPLSTRTSGYADLQVVNQITGQVYAAGASLTSAVSPGLFLSPPTQSGAYRQAAVINWDTHTANTASNKAKRGSYIEIYGTGFGFVPGGPNDGTPPDGPVWTNVKPQVLINGIDVNDSAKYNEAWEHVTYWGLAPGLVGVWQINIQIPKTVVPSSTATTDLVIVVNSMPSYDYTQYRTFISVE